ncbi:GATOR1 complex protein NPRL3 [Hetaerina americana]|uniref:GATOR1 complex protein NPRL3 n=1 Tax=Hetaerina americana TaxID=62018 RepID=UPI003A7F1BA6
METNPLSIILVKSDSKGDRLLFRYPFVTDTRSDIGLHSRRKNPYALTVTEDLLQTPPPQTSNIHNGDLTGFSDEVLSTLFAVKPELCNEKFELKVNDVRFVGHPTLLHSASCPGNQDNPSIILINIVFALQATASHSIVKCYHVLSRRLGISLRHEENRCAYLSKETRTMVTAHDEAVAARPCDSHSWKSVGPDGERGPPESGQGALRAGSELPESPYELILQRSGLARDMKAVYENLKSTGLVHLQVNGSIDISFCLPQRVHRGISDGGSGPPVEPEAIDKCLHALRPYHAILLLVGKGDLKGWLPPRAAPALSRLLAHHSPRKSLLRLTSDTGLTLSQVYQLVGLMVYWAKAMVIFPLCRNNLYAIAPGAPTAPSKVPGLTQSFSEQFQGNGLLATVAHFTPPTTLGNFLLCPSLPPPSRPCTQPRPARTIPAVIWLLRNRFLIQLHTYVFFVPPQREVVPVTTEEPLSSSVKASTCELKFQVGDDAEEPQSTEENGKILNGNGSSHDVSVDLKEGNNEDKADRDVEEPLAKTGLSASERAAVMAVPAASCPEDLALFAKLVGHFKGTSHLEEIMYVEKVSRSQLLQIIDKFRDVLVTFEMEDPALAMFYGHSGE